jgi:hypothetical protein
MAAVLACGPDAVLSHRSAAALWGLRADNRPKTDVSLPRPSARAKRAIEVHRSVTVTPADVTAEDGIPCTTLGRTLLDLGGESIRAASSAPSSRRRCSGYST